MQDVTVLMYEDRWYDTPIFWPFVGLMFLAVAALVICAPFLIAWCFTSPHRAVFFAVVCWGAILGIVFLGLIGGMILDD